VKNRSILTLCFVLLASMTSLRAQKSQTKPDVNKELEQKRSEVEQKSVEVLDLKSALTIQEAELNDLKTEMEDIKSHNQSLADSMKAKQDEIANLKAILKAYEDEKKVSQEVVKTIQDLDTPVDSSEATPLPLDDTDYREDYNTALNLYFDRNYKGAIDGFLNLLSISTTHSLADNCQYWIGECYYSLDDYFSAVAAFQKVAGLGDSNKSDAALFKIGMSYLKMGKKDKAVASFKLLEKQFPSSELVPKAKQYLTTQEKF